MGISTNGITKPYTAGAAVAKRRIVKFGSADGVVIQSTAATDFHMGVSTDIDAATGERCDVFMTGNIVEVDLGGTIARGASVTANASGQAVTATTGQRAIGYAEISGVSGDVGTVLIHPHTAA